MKSVITVLCLLFPVVAFAQDYGMESGDMGKMMQRMEEMQRCMAKIDQADLTYIGEQSQKFEMEIETLCNAGKRDKAQKVAKAFGKKMMKNKAVKQMEKCGEIIEGLPMDDPSMPSADDDFDFSTGHVCDDR